MAHAVQPATRAPTAGKDGAHKTGSPPGGGESFSARAQRRTACRHFTQERLITELVEAFGAMMSRKPPDLSLADKAIAGSTRPAQPFTRMERVAAWGEFAELLLSLSVPLPIPNALRLLIGGAILASLEDPENRPVEFFLKLKPPHDTRTTRSLWQSHRNFRKTR